LSILVKTTMSVFCHFTFRLTIIHEIHKLWDNQFRHP
jgi:hypothetical protein